MKPHQGFSLVELLVSMVLLSSIIFVGSYAYSLFVQKWDGRLGNFEHSFLQTKNFILLHRTISSIKAYVVRDEERNPVLAFWGNSTSIMFISNTPLFERGYPAVVNIEVIAASGGYFLNYREKPLKNDYLVDFFNNVNWSKSIKIEMGSRRIDFRYKGWLDADAKFKAHFSDEASHSEESIDWFEQYSAKERGLMPEEVAIVLTDQSGMVDSLEIPLIDEAEMQVMRYQSDL